MVTNSEWNMQGPVHKKAKKGERPSTKKAVKKHQAVKRTKKSKKWDFHMVFNHASYFDH